MRGELRKKQILNCAKKIFSEKGYYDTQVDDIVEMAQIGKGTIYQYFRNKEDVFLTLLETFATEWEKFSRINLREITDGPPFGSFHVNYLYARISRTLQFFQEDPERSNIVLRMGPGINIEFDRYFKHFESRIIADLNQTWGTSQSCTSCGKCVQVCPTGALSKKGITVAEMEKKPGFLGWILNGREKKQWQW